MNVKKHSAPKCWPPGTYHMVRGNSDMHKLKIKRWDRMPAAFDRNNIDTANAHEMKLSKYLILVTPDGRALWADTEEPDAWMRPVYYFNLKYDEWERIPDA